MDMFSCSVFSVVYLMVIMTSECWRKFNTSLRLYPLKVLIWPATRLFSILLLTSEAFQKPRTSAISGVLSSFSVVVYDTELAVVRGLHSLISTSTIFGLDRVVTSKVLISYSVAFQGTVEERDHLMTLDLICILLCDSQAYAITFPAFCGLIRPCTVPVHISQSVQYPEFSWKSWWL